MQVLLSESEIRDRVGELAGELNAALRGTEVIVIGVLTGCLIFLSDLVRRLEMPLRIGFVQAHSYRGQATTAGELQYHLETLPEVADRHVLLIDDIFDSGQTLSRLADELQSRRPASLRTVVLLTKDVPRQTTFTPDAVGFCIPPGFVVGYGLDFDGRYRNLPWIGVLEEHDQGSPSAGTGDPRP